MLGVIWCTFSILECNARWLQRKSDDSLDTGWLWALDDLGSRGYVCTLATGWLWGCFFFLFGGALSLVSQRMWAGEQRRKSGLWCLSLKVNLGLISSHSESNTKALSVVMGRAHISASRPWGLGCPIGLAQGHSAALFFSKSACMETVVHGAYCPRLFHARIGLTSHLDSAHPPTTNPFQVWWLDGPFSVWWLDGRRRSDGRTTLRMAVMYKHIPSGRAEFKRLWWSCSLHGPVQ